ncbi:MAG TPA: DNA polymerase III subunit beta [bacterium]|nr:DNA polymerase III subunit beta [bacterium]
MQISTHEFKRAVENCLLITPKKPKLSILGLLKLDAGNNSITLSATNLEEHYSVTVPVRNGEEFSALIQGDQLLKVLKNIKNETVELDGERNETSDIAHIRIVSGMTFRLNAENSVEDFPGIPRDDFRKSAAVEILDQKVLFEIMKKVLFSTTQQNVNKAYSGVLFSQKDDHLEVVTTDIHRLTVVTTTSAQTKADFVIPAESVKNLTRMFRDAAITEVLLATEPQKESGSEKPVDATMIMFMTSHECYVSRLLKNEFPNYNRVIDIGIVEKSWFEIERKPLLEKLKTLIDFHAGMKIVSAVFDFVNETLHISTCGGAESSVQTEIPIRPVNENPDAVKITGLNLKYLQEAVSSMGSVAVNLIEGAELKPFYLTDRQPGYRLYHLIMPMRIENIRSRKQIAEQKATKAA